jgi:TRAP-type C4-dicarboxylate transport system permease small subunit
MFLTGLLVVFVVLLTAFQKVPWLDQNAEKVVVVVAFAACTLIVAVEVFRRYVFAQQAPWSTFVPAYLFLWLTWIGCAACVRLRLHLNFGEIRDRLPRTVQYLLMQTDYVLYIVFAVVVFYWSLDLAAMHWEMESIVPGTDDAPSWVFYSATPVGWGLLLVRVAQNAVEDWRDLRSDRPLKLRGTMISLD